MDKHLNKLKAGLVAALAALTSLWGWLGWLWFILVVLMIIDVFLGEATATSTGEWQSSEKRSGIWRKIAVAFAGVIAAIVDIVIMLVLYYSPAQSIPLPDWIPEFIFLPLTLLWFIFTEIGSIIENIGLLGVELPNFLVKSIKVLKAKVNVGGDKICDTLEFESEVEDEEQVR